MPVLVEYIPTHSFFHRLNPMTKIIWTLVVLGLCFLSTNPLLILAVLLSNLVIAAASGVFKNMLPVIKGLFIFSLVLIACQIFFVTEGRTLFYLIPFWQLGRITDVGVNLSVVMALRMLATVSAMPILIFTTPLTDIVVFMGERLKVPFKYAFILLVALRFIPDFMAEMEQILQAQASRGLDVDTKNPLKKLVLIVPLALPLLIAAVKKAQRMAISMEVRGFGSGPRSHCRESELKTADYTVIAACCCILTATIYLKVTSGL